jgi:hypothetical protein
VADSVVRSTAAGTGLRRDAIGLREVLSHGFNVVSHLIVPVLGIALIHLDDEPAERPDPRVAP